MGGSSSTASTAADASDHMYSARSGASKPDAAAADGGAIVKDNRATAGHKRKRAVMERGDEADDGPAIAVGGAGAVHPGHELQLHGRLQPNDVPNIARIFNEYFTAQIQALTTPLKQARATELLAAFLETLSEAMDVTNRPPAETITCKINDSRFVKGTIGRLYDQYTDLYQATNLHENSSAKPPFGQKYTRWVLFTIAITGVGYTTNTCNRADIFKDWISRNKKY